LADLTDGMASIRVSAASASKLSVEILGVIASALRTSASRVSVCPVILIEEIPKPARANSPCARL
jgi:hypothetical protein